MKLSYNWLKDFLELDDSELIEIAEKLTMQAFEVEEIEKTGCKLEGKLVLGEILDIEKHPNADKLQVTKVSIAKKNDGSHEILQIVCGASNIKVGQKVPVACIGSKVFNRKDSSLFEIKKSKIREVESYGMLCSPDELGLSEAMSKSIKESQGDGIYILEDPENSKIQIAKAFKLGDEIKDVLNLQSDYVLEVGARSNRGDALSVIGMAREIAALTGKTLKFKIPKEISSDNLDIDFDPSIKSFKPIIENEDDCAVFYTVALENLSVKDSPEWIKHRLESMGLNSINNIVDISNYVLLEFGQPLHFYDRSKLSGSCLISRRAKSGEPLKTLDEKNLNLDTVNLVIADEERAQCLAGAMGGWDSQIDKNTTEIIIEAAAFNSALVRKSARASGVESESKKRFERGVDKSTTVLALLRAVELLSNYAKNSNEKIRVGNLLKAGSSELPLLEVGLRLSSVKRYLGIEISKEKLLNLLGSLNINLISESEELLSFSIPSFRHGDLKREIDLIEEVGRLYAFNNIPPLSPNVSNLRVDPEKLFIEENIKKSLLARGFNEVILSSLIGETLLSINLSENIKNNDLYIEMDNPLSREHFVLRSSLIPGLINAASKNYAYEKSEDIKLFELGKTYLKKYPEATLRDDCVEESKFSVILISKSEDWTLSKTIHDNLDFFRLKGLILDILPKAKFRNLDLKLPFLHPSISAEIFDSNKSIGVLGKIHPSLAEEFKIPNETFLLEIKYPEKIKEKKFKEIINTPILERDITIDIENSISTEQILDLINKNTGSDLRSVKLVGLFKSDKNAKNHSSSFRLRWQADDRSLEGDEIDSKVKDLKSLLELELGVKFRG